MKKILASVFILIVGCTGIPTESLIGQSRGDVVRLLGNPHDEIVVSDGRILIYPMGPAGKGTYFVQLDHSGRVIRWEDVLTYPNFRKIKVGMHIDEVRRIIGPAIWRWRVVKDQQTIWNYPFNNSICQMFQIAVTPDNKVAEVGFGYAPDCESYSE